MREIPHHTTNEPPADDRADKAVVVVDCPAGFSEIVAERLFAFGASAVSEEQDPTGAVGTALGDPALGDPALGGAGAGGARVQMVSLTGDIRASHVGDLAGFCTHRDLGMRIVEPGDSWKDTWKRFAESHTAGPFRITPPWLEPEEADATDFIELVIDPGFSFGSGSHPTTRACLDLIPDAMAAVAANSVAVSLLDVGVGSGILSIAALKIGAANALGIDVDPNSVEQSPLVAAANGVGDRFSAEATPLDQIDRTYDLVWGNLLITLIEDLGADLVRVLAPGGQLIVSGLLQEQRQRALDALMPLVAVREREIDGWLAIRLTNDGNSDL